MIPTIWFLPTHRVMVWDFVFAAGKHGHMLMAGDEDTEDEREEKGGDDHEMDEDESQWMRDLIW